MRIVVMDDYPDSFRKLGFLSELEGHDVAIFTDTAKGADAMVERLAEADTIVLIQQRSPLRRDVIERLPKLKLICQTGRNVGHIDLNACNERGIVISAGGDGGPGATAELTWALILAALRDLPRQVQRLKDGYWLDSMGSGLAGKTLGVYGLGRIGSLVAEAGRAFGMRVLVWGREGSLERARSAGFEAAASREDFFRTSDVLSLHLPHNRQTSGIVTTADLARMKPDALFVNTSRAGIVEAGALEAALRAGRPGRAAVDVYEEEPVLHAEHSLIGMPNALCTPHLGYSVTESYVALFTAVVEHLRAFEAGEPINVMNPEALAGRHGAPQP
jgi:D-3-phosphoglycerate dehydrogenase / 2-oxoglutarate reductase